MRIVVPFTLALALATPAVAQQPCVTNPAQVVDDVFQHVLERPADAGSAAMTQALAEGRLSVRDIVAQVASSPEYEERFFWPPIVAAAYQQVLQRSPTTAEVRVAARDLAAGATSPGAFTAQLAARAANNNPEAIRMVYRRLLGRDPDPGGLAAYTQMAQRDGLQAVAASIVASPEYRERATANGLPQHTATGYAESVRTLYRHLLGREADAEGLLSLTELASVYGTREPIHRMLNSPEYRQRFGDDGIPGRDARFCGGATEPRAAVPRR